MARTLWLSAILALGGCSDDADGDPVDGGSDAFTPTDAFMPTDLGPAPDDAGADGGMDVDGGALPCGIDCSTIGTMPCQEAICDEDEGRCVVVPAADGAACDDGLFCTVDDRCESGECVGGGPNGCGMTPGPCEAIDCDEASSSCSASALADGTACVSENLCLSDTTCTDGTCGGGTENDCFLTPVPNECHIAVCDPTTGDCVAQPNAAADGMSCVDLSDLCVANKTCDAGSCIGGVAKDCSVLDDPTACLAGSCNPSNGLCETAPIDTCSATSDGCCPSGCTSGDDADC